MSDEINRDRRQLLGTAAVTVASAELGLIALANAQSAEATAAPPPIKPGTRTSFGSLRQMDVGPLNVGYAEAGPGNESQGCRVAPFREPSAEEAAHDFPWRAHRAAPEGLEAIQHPPIPQ